MLNLTLAHSMLSCYRGQMLLHVNPQSKKTAFVLKATTTAHTFSQTLPGVEPMSIAYLSSRDSSPWMRMITNIVSIDLTRSSQIRRTEYLSLLEHPAPVWSCGAFP